MNQEWIRSELEQIMAWRRIRIWTSAGLLSIEPLGTNIIVILIKIQNFSFTKMHLKISSAKWQPFCPGGWVNDIISQLHRMYLTALEKNFIAHYSDVTMGTVTSQITTLTIVYATVYSGADQIKHQSSAPLAFVRGIHRSPVKSPHKGPVTRKLFPFDDVVMDT